jgi:hypothetical protein
MRREAAEREKKLKEEIVQEPEASLRESQLKQMNKNSLLEYAASLGLELQPEMKKDDMIVSILAHAGNTDGAGNADGADGAGNTDGAD